LPDVLLELPGIRIEYAYSFGQLGKRTAQFFASIGYPLLRAKAIRAFQPTSTNAAPAASLSPQAKLAGS
jgi:hypothetical protein